MAEKSKDTASGEVSMIIFMYFWLFVMACIYTCQPQLKAGLVFELDNINPDAEYERLYD